MNDWSKIAEEAKRAAERQGPKCQIGLLLNELSPADAAAVQAAFNDQAVSTAGLYRAIRTRLPGRPLSLWSVGNHRRRGCRCGQ